MSPKLNIHISRPDPALPIFTTTARDALAVRAGTAINADGVERTFADDSPVILPDLIAGKDYRVFLLASGGIIAAPHGHEADGIAIGGFHFAPGGNATGTDGGDDVPAINPFSCWDAGFRPACPDPRGMALIDGRFWCDIYLLNADHRSNDCTSVFGTFIADGNDCPQRVDDDVHSDLNFHTAKAIFEGHGKSLLGAEDFFAMAYGVKERSAAGTDPKQTGLDAPRTSRHGIMQATGNMWTWGTDGHPDDPRASLFGGSWIYGDNAGSRYASLDYWPEYSVGVVGARGRSDHLNRDL